MNKLLDPPGIRSRKIKIPRRDGTAMPALLLSPQASHLTDSMPGLNMPWSISLPKTGIEKTAAE